MDHNARACGVTMTPSAPPGPWHGQLGILAVMLFLASAYFYQDPEWNGNSRLDLTRAIVEKRSFQIDEYVAQAGWATEDRALFEGHYYSDKAIGSSLLAAPFYFVAVKVGAAAGATLGSTVVKHLLTTTVLGGSFTLLGVVMFLMASEISQDRIRALVSTLAVMLGTMLWPYSALYYGHVLAAAFLFLGFRFLFKARQRSNPEVNREYFFAGLSLGLAFMMEYTSAIVIAGLLGYALYGLRGRAVVRVLGAGSAGAAGAALPLSIVGLYNRAIYGRVFAAGYAFEAENRFQQGMSQGFMGLHLPSLSSTYHITFDPQFGVFWLSPVLLLGLAGFFFALRSAEHRAEGLLCVYAIAAMTAMNGGYYLWWGGSAFGPRLLIPALPFFIVPLVLLPRSWIWLLGVLAAVSCGQMLIPLLGQIQTERLSYRLQRTMFYVADAPFTGFSLLYQYSLPQIVRQYSQGESPWTLGSALGLPFWLSAPALIAAEIGLGISFIHGAGGRSRQTRPMPGGRGR